MHLEKELSFQQPQITFLVLGSPPHHTHTHSGLLFVLLGSLALGMARLCLVGLVDGGLL